MAGGYAPGMATNRQFLWVYIDEQQNIMLNEMAGGRLLGVTQQKYQQMEAAANQAVAKAEELNAQNQELSAKNQEYYKILVEKKLIEPELTPEQKIEALGNQVGQLTAILEQQSKVLLETQKALLNMQQGVVAQPVPEAPQAKPVEPEVLPPSTNEAGKSGVKNGFIARNFSGKNAVPQVGAAN